MHRATHRRTKLAGLRSIWVGFLHMPPHRQALVVFLTAFALRAGYVTGSGKLGAPPPDYSEQVRMARYLVHGSGFVSPVGPERDDPSSWYVPGYVGLIAGAFTLLGEDSYASLAVVRMIDLLAQAGAIALWMAVGRRLLGRRVAAIGALLMVLSPAIILKAGEIWDTFPTMFCGAICVAVFVFVRLERWWHQLLAGALCGAAAMVNPCFTACYPVWFVWNRWNRRRLTGRPVQWLVPTGFLLIGFLLVIAPWSLRNRVVFGEWFYLRGNMGLELWVGNAPWSDGYFFSTDGRRIHPVFDNDERDRLVEKGEYIYFKDCMAEARTWIAQEPARVGMLMCRRVKWFWLGRFPEGLSLLPGLLKFGGFTLAGVLGLIGTVIVLARRPRCWILVGTLVVFPIPYYLSIMMVRYRLPIEPLILLLGAVAITTAARLLRRKTRDARRASVE